eukprot:scaffold986_cov237-Pinguiococcus_pyrenoidosus.AAC.8
MARRAATPVTLASNLSLLHRSWLHHEAMHRSVRAFAQVAPETTLNSTGEVQPSPVAVETHAAINV